MIQNRVNYCPALSQETKRDIECRNSLRRMIKSSHNSQANPQYKALVRLVKHKVREDKQAHNERRINDADPKSSWKVAKSILGVNNNKETNEIMDDQGKIESDPTKVANIMNDYFVKKTEDIREQSGSTHQDPIIRVKEQVGKLLEDKEPFELRPVTIYKLRETLARSKGGTSFGHDSIDGRVLKLAAP